MTPLWPRGHLVGGRRVEHWGGCARHPDMRRWKKPRLVVVDAHQSAAALDVGEIAMTLARGHLVLVVSEGPMDHLGLDPGLIRAAPVSDQADADRLIPALLDCPARWRAVVLDGSGAVELDADWMYPRCRECGRHFESRYAAECEVFPHPALGFPADEPPGFRCPGAPRSTNLLDLVIVAGQVGKGAAPCDLANVRAARDQCAAAGVGFVIARLGSRPTGAPWKRTDGRWTLMRDHPPLRSRSGADPSEWPADLSPYAAAAGPLAGGES